MEVKIGKRDYIDRGCIANVSVSRHVGHVGRAQDTDRYAAFVPQSTRLDGRGWEMGTPGTSCIIKK